MTTRRLACASFARRASMRAACVGLTVALAMAASTTAVAQTPGASGGPLIPEQACFDVLHYRLEVEVDPQAKAIAGRLSMRARVVAKTARVALDLDPRLHVSSVQVGAQAALFRHEDGRIWIDLEPALAKDAELAVNVAYAGKPIEAPRPPWQGGFTWAETPDGKPWIATSCQGEGADLWWPCKDQPGDEPDTFDLLVTLPHELFCAANGTLQSDEPVDEGKRHRLHWHVSNPINNYCVALNIAPYACVERTYECTDGTALPVWFWCLPAHREQVQALMPEVVDHLRVMEQLCGPYPFRNEKYGVVETPHLGMEHQTIIAYGNGFKKQAPGYDWLLQHEMSHEWWGNLVTCRDWKDMWIHEGIGTYMQALYVEKRFGADAYRATMAEQRRSIANRRPVAPRESQDSRQIYFAAGSNDIYYKGSWVMHTLRWLLGDDTFFTALRRMAYPDPALEKVTDGSQCRFTDTEEIRAIAEKAAGRELGWFFDVYLRQPHLPELVAVEKDGVLELQWKVPQELPFPMPVPVRVGDEVRRVEMKDGRGSVELHGAAFAVDPAHWLLKDEPRTRRRSG